MYVEVDEDGQPKMTINDALWVERVESGLTQLEAMDRLMRDACVFGRTFYTSDGRPIPLSSWFPRRGDLSGTQS